MTTIKPIAAAVIALAAFTQTNPALAADVEDRIAELEKQLADLKATVVSNQQEITANQEEIEVVRPARKGTSFKYGGFVQLDSITSDYEDGKPGNDLIDDFLVPSLIPVEPASGPSDSYTNTNIHAKSSRFYFTTSTPTDVGEIATRVELDFMLSDNGDERISNSWNSRLRHAFVKWNYGEGKSLMAGQSWSTFFNVGALPDVLDFVGPAGTIFVRQPQVRWTSGNWQLAIENPATRLNQWDGSSTSTRLDDSETLPDLIARYNGKTGDLSWSVAAIARQLSYEARSGSAIKLDDDEEMGYGVSASGKWMFGRDDLRVMLNYGSALGRYMGLNSYNDGYIDTDGSVETIDQWGAVIAYQHYWSAEWRSTFSISASAADNPDTDDFGGAEGLAESYQSLHANLNWMPAPRLQLGGEVIYGKKELEDGREGSLNRLQLAVKYAF